MQSDRFSIMVVDDADESSRLLNIMLSDKFNVHLSRSGAECLALLPEVNPDLVLLDVIMPDMTGYQICRQLKASPVYRDIPVIFVTAGTSAEEKVAGYESGCDEYVTKPFDVEDLLGKIARSLEIRGEEIRLRDQALAALAVAKNAMTGSTELGIINRYLQRSGNPMSYVHIAENLLEATRSLGLNSSVVLKVDSGMRFFGCQPESLEARLLEKFSGAECSVDFQSRSIFNSQQCSVLVKNMPIDDEARCRRLKEHLTTLVYATDHRVASTETIHDLIQNSDEDLARIRAGAALLHSQRKQIMMQLLVEVEEQLFSMGLDDDQEKRLVKLLDEGAEKVDALPDIGDDIESSLELTRQALTRLLNEQPGRSH